MCNNIGRNPPRQPPNPESAFCNDSAQSFRLKVKDPSEGLRLLRFLCTKFYARGKTLSNDEEALFYTVAEYISTVRQGQFGKKIMQSIELLALFRLISIYCQLANTEYPAWLKNQVAILIKKASFMTPRAFLGYEKTFRVDRFIQRTYRHHAKEPIAKRFIGVGYRDKGNCRSVSQDGTPSWQEYASAIQSKPSLDDFKKQLYREAPFRLLLQPILRLRPLGKPVAKNRPRTLKDG